MSQVEEIYSKCEEAARKWFERGGEILIASQPGTGRPDVIPLSESLKTREPSNPPKYIDYIGLMGV